MKRTLPYIFSIFFILAGNLNLSAQVDGLMFSMTYGGGLSSNSDFGVINQFDPLTNYDTARVDFTGLNGAEAYGNFIQLNNGLLYGMTAYNCADPIHSTPLSGSIIQYNIQTGKDSILYTLPNTHDNFWDSGEYFYGSLCHATNDSLYGMTYQGGGATYHIGVIFSFNYHTGAYRVLKRLRSITTGSYPTGSFIQVSPSLLYGMTTYNSEYSSYFGTIFTYNIITGDTNKVYVFNGGPGDGAYPNGTLLQASNGLLYGLTEAGGTSGNGVLFSFDTGTKTETVLVNFNGANGAIPYRSLIQASDGNLYGTTESGGAHDSGTLFRYNIGTNTETVLYSFNGSDTDGYYPYADVIQASDGKLYGSTLGNTSLSGKNNWGTIFSYDIGSGSKKTLHYYNDSNGAFPYGDLLEAMSDNVTVVNNHCPSDMTGSLTIHVRGGKPPLTYLWSTGATTSSITNLVSGIYSDTVWDSRGIRFINIDTVKPLPMVLTFNVSNACYDTSDASVFVKVAGGTNPFSYLWSNAETNDTIFNLSIGTYTCTIKDANGCSASSTVTITQAAPLTITSIVATEQTYPFYNGKVIVHVTGGVPPGDTACYLYTWSNGGSSVDSITNLDSGYYSVCITSCYGCGSTCSDTVKVLTNTNNINNPGNLVKVYPVPSSGLITLNLTGYNFENLEITDALGISVYKEILSPQVRNNTLHIDLSAQPDGVYILYVTPQQGILTRKIIIQK